ETFESLVSFTSNLTSTLFDSAYSALASDCRPLVFQLFSDIKRHLSGDANSSLDKTVRRFYNDLFPLVYRRLLNPGFGHMSPQSYSSLPSSHDDCLRMTRQDVSPFGPHPHLLVSSLSRALGVGRALSRLLRLAGEVVNATEKATLSRECGRGLALMKLVYCPHCRGMPSIKPCSNYCSNVMKGCLANQADLDSEWQNLIGDKFEFTLIFTKNRINGYAIKQKRKHGMPKSTVFVSTMP
uniref:Glypican 5b n=1 Tax=Sphaeramia orbicularis TaxID=375764 RepID=A0A673C977_9TELE